MKGVNVITVNTETVIAAMQEYLDKRFTATKQHVNSFELDTSQYGNKTYKIELVTEEEA